MPWWAILIVVAAAVGSALAVSGWALARQGRVAEHAHEESPKHATHRRPPLRRN